MPFKKHIHRKRPQNAVVTPTYVHSEALENELGKWEMELLAKNWFSQDEIDVFKQIRSRNEFIRYCEENKIEFEVQQNLNL